MEKILRIPFAEIDTADLLVEQFTKVEPPRILGVKCYRR